MSNITFRNATHDDLPRIVDIYNSTIPGRMVTADTEPVTVASREDWFHKHDTTKRPLWIVEDENGAIAGWVSFSSFYGRPAYNGTVEVSIYLDASQRGKGLGKKVLQHVIDEAPKYEVKTILGFIFAHNIPSLKLFEHFGFAEWANLPEIAVLDGVARSLIILGKRIQ
ncbi:GNAT family N-acetyltransferase [Chitinophaga sedimenti]|uniref:GNAT family N-acetyltransferase n=1 Tax=Chitinophaga sedimenti TaxID=2033606 RepID=UPI002004C135|nr:GNAT family N-acetyltransferase [Chitinophaga sedimenti]MCK7556162.1 GNAT family N-acetyltransferase [Chitinophaga sedimenti]